VTRFKCGLMLATVLVFPSVVGGVGETPVSLGVRNRSNANPSIAAQGQFVVVVWGASAQGSSPDVYAGISRDGGRTFGAPLRVNDGAGDVRLSGEQPPRVALVTAAGRDPSITVVWTATSADGTRLMTARSDDGGASFTSAAVVPGANAPGNRGWESIAADRDGHLSVVWLDHRELADGSGHAGPAPHHHGHQHGGHPGARDGMGRAQLSKLYFGRLDGSIRATALTGGVCYCCKTSLAAGSDGSLYAAWRHVYPGNVRDIAFTVSRDGGRTFARPGRVSEDQWILDGCPENGPAISVDEHQRVHVVWPTVVSGSDREPALALFYSSTTDGRRFSRRQAIPISGVPRHPQLVMNKRAVLLIAWDEQANGTRRIVAAEGASDGRDGVRFTRVAIGGDERGEYPMVSSVDDAFVIAWTSGAPAQSVIRVDRVARATVPQHSGAAP
jgi:hypothetical protein